MKFSIFFVLILIVFARCNVFDWFKDLIWEKKPQIIVPIVPRNYDKQLIEFEKHTGTNYEKHIILKEFIVKMYNEVPDSFPTNLTNVILRANKMTTLWKEYSLFNNIIQLLQSYKEFFRDNIEYHKSFNVTECNILIMETFHDLGKPLAGSRSIETDRANAVASTDSSVYFFNAFRDLFEVVPKRKEWWLCNIFLHASSYNNVRRYVNVFDIPNLKKYTKWCESSNYV